MKTALATVTLSGTLREKFAAAARAGFDGIEIFENDLTQFEGSAKDVRLMADDFGLEIIALQPFRDMEGMPEPQRSLKFSMLQKKMQLAHELGTNRLLFCSNVQPYSSADRQRCAADLHELAEMAAKENIKLGYEALAWGYHIADYPDAWDLVKRADHPNLGIVLDTFHMFSRGNTLDCLRDEIPLDKIALVQVADAPSLQMDVLQYSRHFRCFPGQGDMPVVEFLSVLKAKGFDDYLSHEIFNDEFRSSSPLKKAIDGKRSLLWLDDQTSTLEPAFKTPSVEDIEFVEFGIDVQGSTELIDLLKSLGFSETHRHKSKDVSLMRQGNINLILNREPQSQAREHYQQHGVSVCALALACNDIKSTLALAERYQCERFSHQTGPGELNIPAIRGIGNSLVYFVDAKSKVRFFDVDFEKIDESDRGIGLNRIDHMGQTVSNTDFLSAGFFYKSLFDFSIEASQDLSDIYGLVVSRVAVSPNKKIRIPLNMTNARHASASRFLNKSKGSGVQQIAFSCDDIFEVVAQVDAVHLLSIPENYYRDIDARFGLEAEFVARLQAYNLLYDRNEDGEFLHFYTLETNGVFFEVVQRLGNYDRYGEGNAFVRLAAQARHEVAKSAS